MAANTPLNEQDHELLSTYLDNQLRATERAELEARLSAEPALRAELESLRQTVTVLKAAPNVALPRNFTLDVARYRRPTPWWARFQTMQLMGAVGTLAAVLLIAFGAATFTTNQAASPASFAAKSSGSVANNVALAPTVTASPLPTEPPATSTALPTATFVLPTSVALQAALPTATAQNKFYSQSAAAGQPALQAAGQAAQQNAQEASPLQPPSVPAPAVDMAQSQATERDAIVATAVAEEQPFGLGTPEENQASSGADVIAPKDTNAPTEVAVIPTAAPIPALTAGRQVTPAAPPVILIIGIALLIFSIMLFGIGWLRSRLRG